MKTLQRVLHYLCRYSFSFVGSILLAGITVAGSLYIPILTGRGIDLVVGTGNVDFDSLEKLLFRMGFVVLITAFSQWGMNACNNRMTYRMVQDIRRDAFAKIGRLPFSYLDSHSHGDVVSRIIADTDQIGEGLLLGFSQIFTGVITIFGTLVFMLMLNVKITLVVVIITPISFVTAGYISRKTYHFFREQSQTRAEETALINEIIGNEKVVQVYGQEENVIHRFEEINRRLGEYSLKAIFFSSLTNPTTRFINSLVYAGVLFTGAFLAISGGITVGQLSCFLSYATQYSKPFNEISGVVTEFQNALACAGRVFELIFSQEEESDENARSLDQVNGEVVLLNVAFSYVKGQDFIKNLNLKAERGERIAIVGPTGCGKTTLINLLMRFYDVSEGEIRVSGIPVRELTRESLRAGFGMVLQDTWIKKGTIADNIRLGRPEASMDDVEQAAREAFAHGFIQKLPGGYQTVIGEDGGSLSEGQKQLLCIARVMLCRPSMLILDEATSSIDTRTECKVQKAFDRLMEGRTCFLVAHRLSTIQEADRILVMDQGKILEQGNHKELMGKKGMYFHLVNSQFQQESTAE